MVHHEDRGGWTRKTANHSSLEDRRSFALLVLSLASEPFVLNE
jgi:hypothetical protein